MQNEKNLQQLVREYESNMPAEIMDIIKAFDWKRELRTIVMQNQLMVDVGADLEQSVYLLLLGVAKVEDVYERLIDIHELSADRSKKVLEEIEIKIFDVLHKKLAEMDAKEEESIVTKAQKPNTSNEMFISDIKEAPEARDAILAEIEKEESPIVVKSEVITEQKPAENPLAKITYQKVPEAPQQKPVIHNGITKPFSLETEKVTEQPIFINEKPEKVEGIQEDPIGAGLKKATIVKPVQTETPIPAKPVASAPDPYREPIE